jgi:hypothetical protein
MSGTHLLRLVAGTRSGGTLVVAGKKWENRKRGCLAESMAKLQTWEEDSERKRRELRSSKARTTPSDCPSRRGSASARPVPNTYAYNSEHASTMLSWTLPSFSSLLSKQIPRASLESRTCTNSTSASTSISTNYYAHAAYAININIDIDININDDVLVLSIHEDRAMGDCRVVALELTWSRSKTNQECFWKNKFRLLPLAKTVDAIEI